MAGSENKKPENSGGELDSKQGETPEESFVRISPFNHDVDARRGQIRDEMELALCNIPYKGVLIYGDTEEFKYKNVLKEYEEFMLMYESMASEWEKHYRRIQKSIDNALGIKKYMSDDLVRETLSKVGCITLFGCGYNPTRELSNKLKNALRKGYVRLVLVDFSKKALRSATDFLLNSGIKPGAAYQMDLTSGVVGTIDSYMRRLYSEAGGKLPRGTNRLQMYVDLVEQNVDRIIERYKNEGVVPGNFKGYLVRDCDKAGLAVSPMMAAATFLTVYYKLINIIVENTDDDEERENLLEQVKNIHSKFNAFVVQLVSGQMLEFCKDEGSALIMAEINKVDLGLDIDQHSEVLDEKLWLEQAELAAEVRDAVEYGTEDEETGKLLESVRTEVRISRQGLSPELMEDVVRSTPSIDNRYEVITEPGEEWWWWDEPLSHGHIVRKVQFKKEKKGRFNALDLLMLLPEEIQVSADPKLIAENITGESSEGDNDINDTGLSWLKGLNLSDAPPQDESLEGHRPYALLAATELIKFVPEDILIQGWRVSLEYLQRDLEPASKRWLVDNRTKRHVQVGYSFLVELVTALNE